MKLILQLLTRRCDKPGRIYTPGGRLAARSVNITFKDASHPRVSMRPSRMTSQQFRYEPSWRTWASTGSDQSL